MLRWEKKEERYESGSYEATSHNQRYWSACHKYTIQRDRSRPEDRYGLVGQWNKFTQWTIWDEILGCVVNRFDKVSQCKQWVKEYDALPPLPVEA